MPATYPRGGPPGPAGPEGPAGPAGPPGTGGSYEHDQAVAAAVWTVQHSLGAIPSSVSVVDTAGTVVLGRIDHDDANTLTLTFSAPFSGKAYVST